MLYELIQINKQKKKKKKKKKKKPAPTDIALIWTYLA